MKDFTEQKYTKEILKFGWIACDRIQERLCFEHNLCVEILNSRYLDGTEKIDICLRNKKKKKTEDKCSSFEN